MGFVHCVLTFGTLVLVLSNVSPNSQPLDFKSYEAAKVAHPAKMERLSKFIACNTSNCEIRVVGSNAICQPGGCIFVEHLPLTIPPLGEAELSVTNVTPKDTNEGIV